MASRGIGSLLTRPATDLAALVRQGEISATELVAAALARVEERRDLNAFTFVWPEEALAQAGSAGRDDPRPFAGVPIAIKELNAVAGKPHTRSSYLFGEVLAREDAYAVRRLRNAGFVIIGRTNSPEFGIVPVTEPRRFGPTRNPWDVDRTPGGSSGGAAAAVAGGILPVAHASDGGGSIRIPAACCGLVGLKPSRGRISAGPDLGDNFLSTQGVVTRTVADTAALLDIMAGYEPGDATWAPPPLEPFAAAASREPGTLRIAYSTTPPVETPVDPTCASVVLETARLLSALGHHVEEATPARWVNPSLVPHFSRIWAAQVAAGVRLGAMLAGREPEPEDLEPLTWEFYRMGMATTSVALLEAVAILQLEARRLISCFSQFDVFLTPALAKPPVHIGEIDTCAADPMSQWERALQFTPFTPTWNVTGQPAISLPIAQGEDGLPRAVQIVGPPAGEGLLLSLASQLEVARPWAERLPPGV